MSTHARPPEPPPRSLLEQLLLDYTSAGNNEARGDIEQEIWEQFGSVGAVMVLDMAGFSRTTRDKGIVHYLAMIERMHAIARPIIEHVGGQVVKFEADNCFTRFPDVDVAVETAIALNIAVAATNRTTPEDIDIEFACGIDYGRLLLVDGRDFWGAPVNRACKLGEDIGKSGEILVTAEAMERVEDKDRFRTEPAVHSISGLRIEAFRVLY